MFYYNVDGFNPLFSDPITGEKPTPFHTLSWTCQFPFENDTVYFAHSFPYTYSDLQEYLTELINDPKKSQWCTVDTLCHSLAGNRVYVLTIFSPIEGAQVLLFKKRVIVVTARVHPGETPSSWVMKGLIDLLTGDTTIAQTLREKFIFKLVPMLNPDGVIVGNNRYSLSGRDLNRTYKTLLKDAFPPTWHLRRMVRRMLEDYEVCLYCDLHGHSRKPNMFVYGCENPSDSPNYLREQIFPLVLGQHAPNMFSFAQCKFHMHKQREGTGRVVMWLMGVTNSYTLEVSFGGSTLGERRATHFSTSDYRTMAEYLCLAIADYFDDSKAKVRCYFNEFEAGKTMENSGIPRFLFDSLGENLFYSNLSNPGHRRPIHCHPYVYRCVVKGSESSVESALTEDQIDESLNKGKQQLEKKSGGTGVIQNETGERTSLTCKKMLKKRLFSCKSNPTKLSGVDHTKPNRQRYQKSVELQNQERCVSNYNLIRKSSPRRTRLRSLLNLQRNIIAQALVLRESSPLHKKLTKTILKETLAMSENLSKELQLLNEADRRSFKHEIAEKNKNKAIAVGCQKRELKCSFVKLILRLLLLSRSIWIKALKIAKVKDTLRT
uniref:Peptidase M14 domain-containing protein n=1 Tax=Strigamia maritima TaxID=126957 RepID=T1IZX3_STRMM